MDGELLALGVIPARANSSRFPFKVIAKINGKPMVQYVWEAARSSTRLSDVVIATDDETVRSAVLEFGGKVTLTSNLLASGTDRVGVVARETNAAFVLCLQGDEPLLPGTAIDRLIEALVADESADMATLAVKSSSELNNPNVVKVAVDETGTALNFSRQPLGAGSDGEFLKHVGIYAYRREALLKFCALPPSPRETAERLEQLRALENGFRIKVVLLEMDLIAVDVPEDIQRVEAAIESSAI